MLTTIMNKLARASASSTNDDAANLLASCSLPDPQALQRELAAIEAQLGADDAAWERLDRTSNPHAFAQQQSIANRRGRLEAERDVLRRRIATAESRRAAFVALWEIVRAMDQEIVQESQRLYTDFLLIASKDERRNRLDSLDARVRARARIAAPLAVVSPAREFRRAPDPLGALADDLRARADEIDRQRAPGMRGSAFAALPDGASELIAALNEGRSA